VGADADVLDGRHGFRTFRIRIKFFRGFSW
jgi:hypothetical protein